MRHCDYSFGSTNAVNLEHVLGDIQTDRGNLHVDGSPSVIRLTTITLWHFDAGSGRRPPHQTRTSIHFQNIPDMIATAHAPTFDQCHAMRVRSGLSLTKGLLNSLGLRRAGKSNCVPGIQGCFRLPGLAARYLLPRGGSGMGVAPAGLPHCLTAPIERLETAHLRASYSG